MQSKAQEPKSYSYHFCKALPAQAASPLLSEPFSPLALPRSVNINFRYHTDGQPQDSEKRGPYFRRESLKTHNCAEKRGEPPKRYTFSLLASEARQRALESKEPQPPHLDSAESGLPREPAADWPRAEANRGNSVLK